MSYGHAERNLALIHQLEAKTRQLFGNQVRPNQEQFANPPIRVTNLAENQECGCCTCRYTGR
jgi:hypothetical protein